MTRTVWGQAATNLEKNTLNSQKEFLEYTRAFTKRHAFIACLEIFYALVQNHIISVDREVACKRLATLSSQLNLKS